MAKTSYPQRGKRISFSRFNNSSVAEKGHFVVYTGDQSQLVFSIPYLNNYIFQELLNMPEEEFGLPSNEPIKLPFDAMFIKYAVSLIRGCVDRNLKEALLNSIAITKCSLSHNDFHHDHTNSQQLLACSC